MNFTRGFNFKRQCSYGDRMVILNDTTKIILDATASDEDSRCYFTADAETTATWLPGDYRYQILGLDGVKEEGDIKILQNFALAEVGEDYKSHYRKIIDAIDAVIEGRATQAQQHVAIGDKNITYYSIDELLKYRNYFTSKLAEEEGTISKIDEHQILYTWRSR